MEATLDNFEQGRKLYSIQGETGDAALRLSCIEI